MNTQSVYDAPTENALLETDFSKPIILITYTGPFQVHSVEVKRYDLITDGKKKVNKLGVSFAFAFEAYEHIRSGIALNKSVEAEKHQPIKPIKKRPVAATKQQYQAGTGKSVRITMRSGHVLSGKQRWASKYNLFVEIANNTVLVYQHGVHQYEITAPA